MNNQKLILTIGFILLGIIGYQGYLLYQKENPSQVTTTQKDMPQITVKIDKQTAEKKDRSIPTTSSMPKATNLTQEERHKLDEERIEKSIQDLFKSIFASQEVQEGLKQFKEEAQRGIKEMQAQLQTLPQQLDNLTKQIQNDPFFSEIIGELQSLHTQQFEDRGDYYFFQTTVPGKKESKIDIQAQKKFLIITILSKEDKTKQTAQSKIVQSHTQSTREAILIPQDALIEKLQTRYEDGILQLIIPKVKAKAQL